jgi:hypothetical protein
LENINIKEIDMIKVIILFGVLLINTSLWGKGAKPPSVFHPSEILKLCKRKVLTRNHWVLRTQAPNLDQGLDGTCYAHAAATALDIYRDLNIKNNTMVSVIDLKLKHKISGKKSPSSWKAMKMTKRIGQTNPIWLAYNYSNPAFRSMPKGTKKDFDGGTSEPILSDLIKGKYGSCKENVIADALKPFTLREQLNMTEFYAFTTLIMKDPYRMVYMRRLLSKPKPKPKHREIIKRLFTKRQQKKLRHLFENIDYKKLLDVIKNYKDSEYNKFFGKVFADCKKSVNQYSELKGLKRKKVCDLHRSGRKELAGDVLKHYSNMRRFNKKLSFNSVIGSIASALNRNSPVVYGYNANILNNDKEIRTLKDLLVRKKGPQDIFEQTRFQQARYDTRWMSSGHASVIAGKRVRGKSCEFLIQNSWGNYCKYTNTWECQKDRNGREMGVWISAEEVARWGRHFAYIESKKNSCVGDFVKYRKR